LVVGVADSFALGTLFLMLFQVSNQAVDDFAYSYAMIIGALKFVKIFGLSLLPLTNTQDPRIG
jgi:hypothetical protein